MARKRYAIPQYGTVIMAGTEYYRTRIEDPESRKSQSNNTEINNLQCRRQPHRSGGKAHGNEVLSGK